MSWFGAAGMGEKMVAAKNIDTLDTTWTFSFRGVLTPLLPAV